jgi:hypothetical protein
LRAAGTRRPNSPRHWLIAACPNCAPSIRLCAIEQALQAYPGALIVVSHDARFLDALQLTHELHSQNGIWRLSEK